MNCAAHPETAAVAFCRNCGRAVCDACRQEWQGVPHCSDCVEKLSPPEPSFTAAAEPAVAEAPQGASASQPPQPPQPATPDPAPGSWRPAPSRPVSSGTTGSWDTPSPVLAFLAGIIPGVGAVYNGQYAKGVVHALVWGGLLSTAIAAEQTGPPGSVAVFIVLLVMTTLYMPIEAHAYGAGHSARRSGRRVLGTIRCTERSGRLAGRGSAADLDGGGVSASIPGLLESGRCSAFLARHAHCSGDLPALPPRQGTGGRRAPSSFFRRRHALAASAGFVSGRLGDGA